MIKNVASFMNYFTGIRRRTLNYIQTVPVDKVEWSPGPGEYTNGDLIRHIASAETMFVGVALNGRWQYPGHQSAGVQSLADLILHMEAIHLDAMALLSQMKDEDLSTPRASLDGPEIKAWRWLMAMAEHEIHHRSQLANHLYLMGVKPPHMFGLGVEDIIARATG